MAYSTPLTAVANAALTAAQWNASVRDDMLETPAAKFTAAGRIFVSTGANAGAERAVEADYIATSQSTASTSYTNLGTTGPQCTLTTGVRALHFITNSAGNSTAGDGAHTQSSVAISGATTLAANDNWATNWENGTTNIGGRVSAIYLQEALTAGSNTFTVQYRVAVGTGTWDNRHLTVIGL